MSSQFERRTVRFAGILAGTIASCGFFVPAAAQDAPAPDETLADEALIVLDPITVYGARNVTALEDSAASIAVVTAEQIDTRVINSFRDAFRLMGNVMDADWLDAGFIIRGVNSEGLVPGGAPLASFYIDGIQQTGNAVRRGARGTWDIEQVEVYRGPQSTLSGRAALAGAIYMKTKDPTFEQVMAVQGTLGNFDTAGGAFMINTPLGDQVALRIAGEYERSETDINYPDYRGFHEYDNLIEDEYYQIRAKLLITPDALPDTRALLTYSFSHDSPTIDDIAGPGLGFDFDDDRGDFNEPVYLEPRENDVHNAALEVTHDINEALRFTSLSTASISDQTRNSVNFGTPGETEVMEGYQDQTLATQEFRLNYNMGKWSAVAGIYGAHETLDAEFERLDPYGRFDVSDSTSKSWTLALFGEATYEFLPTWKVTAGARVDRLTQNVTAFNSRNGVVSADDDLDYEETAFLPKIGLSKDLNEFHTIGVTIQRGFRNGGSGVHRTTGETYEYNPEYTWNYEAFYKGSFMEDRLKLNANVFFQDWSDQQVEIQTIPGDYLSSRIVNAASSRSYGFELEGSYQITAGLSAFASIGHVQTEFLEFTSVSLGDLSGYEFPEAPEWSIAFGALYEHSSGLYVGADAKYTSSYLARFGYDPQEYLDERIIANVQAGYRAEHFEIAAYVENLFDERYFVYNDNDVAAALGDRREFGVRGKMMF